MQPFKSFKNRDYPYRYKGFMVSDWGSIAELIPHGYAEDKMQAGELAVVAGSDMDMEGGAYESSLESLPSSLTARSQASTKSITAGITFL